MSQVLKSPIVIGLIILIIILLGAIGYLVSYPPTRAPVTTYTLLEQQALQYLQLLRNI